MKSINTQNTRWQNIERFSGLDCAVFDVFNLNIKPSRRNIIISSTGFRVNKRFRGSRLEVVFSHEIFDFCDDDQLSPARYRQNYLYARHILYVTSVSIASEPTASRTAADDTFRSISETFDDKYIFIPAIFLDSER